MCDIQYKGQLSKEQVRELVKKYPLEDPATHKDLQHLADALDRNGTWGVFNCLCIRLLFERIDA